MKALNLILVFLVVLSCGCRTKQLYKKGTESKTEQTVVDTKKESEDSSKESTKKEKVNKNTESNVQNKNNSTKKESEKKLNVEREEPLAFNIVFPIALFAMLGLILFLVLKRFKILK